MSVFSPRLILQLDVYCYRTFPSDRYRWAKGSLTLSPGYRADISHHTAFKAVEAGCLVSQFKTKQNKGLD